VRLMDDQDLRKRLGTAGQRRVAEQFSPEAYLELYSELIVTACERKYPAIQ